MILRCGRFRLDLREPVIMAILNVTPDSFSGDGLYHQHDMLLHRAEQALEEGAGMLDIGGESTRPGSDSVSEQEELDRVLPVLERLVRLGVPVSVDTVKPVLMREAIACGASMINDICAFRVPGAIAAVADTDAALCVMHMQGQPRDMQSEPCYDDVVTEVGAFLRSCIAALSQAGIAGERLVIDPGFGFGKTVDHNYELLRKQDQLFDLGYPLLAGLSRKTMLGAVTGRDKPQQRVVASAVAALLAVQKGASIVRVHDVAATRDALRVWAAFNNEI